MPGTLQAVYFERRHTDIQDNNGVIDVLKSTQAVTKGATYTNALIELS
jgi:hypothetical protein